MVTRQRIVNSGQFGRADYEYEVKNCRLAQVAKIWSSIHNDFKCDHMDMNIMAYFATKPTQDNDFGAKMLTRCPPTHGHQKLCPMLIMS